MANNSLTLPFNQDRFLEKEAILIHSTKELKPEEFREIRRIGIGGSDAPGLTGMSKYKSPLSIYISKKGLTDKEVDNDFIRWGNILEPVIRGEFSKDFEAREGYPIEVAELPYTFQSREYPFMIANIDGLVYDSRQEAIGGLEIKTATIMQSSNWKDGEVPDDYYCQIQHYMAVLGLPFFYIVCLLGKSLIWRFVPRNENFINWLIGEERKFWEHHIEASRMPSPTALDEDSHILQHLYFNQTEDEIVLLNDLEEDLKKYDELSEVIQAGRKAENERRLYANKIKARLENAKKGESSEFEVSWSRFETTRVDSTRLKKEQPDLYKEYSKTGESGRLTVKSKEAKEKKEEVA